MSWRVDVPVTEIPWDKLTPSGRYSQLVDMTVAKYENQLVKWLGEEVKFLYRYGEEYFWKEAKLRQESGGCRQ